SSTTHPWLRDHALADSTVLPPSAFLELVLAAGAEVGCDAVDELTVEAPLVLPERGAVQFQVAIAGADHSGRRRVTVHSTDTEAEWTRHATGVILPDRSGEPAEAEADRKSTRLNSSHRTISYAVFCLKKK